ncbi:psbP domain-containing protein 3, chloroplastic [Impatiens glandulifera]|uniref:psbP domain-containing protein 3, chloroplastic n=1 Tax=Impatiens glandulifera TaxID=253017 RepID=UPI001FB0BB77|nr:psbP domain-containing protein 3, chloroplastic [Impatiens glandulifera]
MAPLSCLHIHQFLPPLGLHPVAITAASPPPPRFSSSSNSKLIHSLCRSCLRTTTNNNQNQNSRIQFQGSRREALFAAFSFPALLSLPPLAWAVDTASDFRLYSDDLNKYKIMIPQVSFVECQLGSALTVDWQVGAGDSNGINSVTAFVPQESSGSNVSVVITGLGADFTRVESFGKVYEFAESLVGGLDRSWQRPPGVSAKLIDSKSSNGLYYIEYTLQNPGESRRHLISVLGVANNGWYNRLYTVTGQYLEEDSEKYGSKIEQAIASFRFI